MCFSATASFTTAAAIGLIGVGTVLRTARAGEMRALPLALFPLIFASQQLLEGLLWLVLEEPGSSAAHGPLTQGFLVYAEGFWPIFAPLAALLIEPDRLRQRLILVCLICGVAVALYLILTMVDAPYAASIRGAHIVYDSRLAPPDWTEAPYLVATTLSLGLSSHRDVRRLGVVIFVGFVISLFLYREAFVSVWCFFAASASLLVALHFFRGGELARRVGVS